MSLLHAAALVIKDNKVLLTKRALSDKSEPGKWCPINESLEKNEQPAAAVIRGAKEELGISFKIDKRLPDWDYGVDTTYVFVGTFEGDINPDPKEIAEYGWFSYEDAMILDFAYGYEELIQDLNDKGLLT
jgi:8-oxo-dGTP pyrophosphatase MutT (NUDIX family)